MSKKERERTIAELSRAGIPFRTIKTLLRYGATLHRLAEAQCNGDWPCDNGERNVRPCRVCESLWAPSVLKRNELCPDCRTTELIEEACQAADLIPVIQGDPRGAVLLVKLPTMNDHDRGIFVA